MPSLPALAAFAALGYLCGSIPFGLLLTRLFAGKDVREVGSRNIGATNVVRAAGKLPGALTLLLDAAKGALPAYLALHAGGFRLAAPAGLCAFLGHLYPPWLRFRGGKGVATALGVFAVLAPWAALCGAAAYGAILALTRVSALGSLGGAAVVLIAAIALRAPAEVIALCAVIDALILWRHRGNLAELRHKRAH